MSWPEAQLRRIARFAYGDSLADAVRAEGSVPVYGSNGRVGQHNCANTGGPAIVIGRKGSFGKVQFSEVPVFAIDTTFFVDSTQTNADLRWLYYALGTLQLDELSEDVGVPGLSREKAYAQRLPLPPLDEQRAIADYLDRETARIDALIAAKMRELKLLVELFAGRRDRTFSGLSAPHVQLGRFVRSIGQGTSPQAEDRLVGPGEWGVLKLSAVKAGAFNPLEHKALPADVAPIPSLVPRVGDLLVTRANTPELVGDACAVRQTPDHLMLCDLIYVLRLSPSLEARFAAEALLTRSARAQLSSAARGTSQSMVKLRGEDVKSVRLPVPSLDVQQTVIAAIDSDRDRHLRATAAVRRSVALLRERRQALITAAITGQIEVPVAA